MIILKNVGRKSLVILIESFRYTSNKLSADLARTGDPLSINFQQRRFSDLRLLSSSGSPFQMAGTAIHNHLPHLGRRRMNL